MPILEDAPEGAAVFDPAPLRAARAEVRAQAGTEAPVIKLAAGYVQLAAEIPLDAALQFQSSNIRAGLAGMLADPSDVDAVLDGFTAQDLAALTAFLNTSLGESLASS